MDKRDLAQEWFTIAEFDLASAEHLKSMVVVPNGIICYHCQQSAEKYLKGFLNFCEIEIPKTHDLKRLTDLCAAMDSDFTSIFEDCIVLTDYAVAARYPFYGDIPETEMNSAIERAKRIRKFIQSKFMQ